MSEREQIALKTVRRHAWWSAGGASIPIPLVDLVVIAAAQLKMLAELSRIYGLAFERVRGKAMIGALMGFALQPTLSTGLVSTLLKTIPGVGALLGTPSLVLFAGAYTWALGRVFIQHFESGGTFLDFDPEAVRQHFQAQLAAGMDGAVPIDAAGDPLTDDAPCEGIDSTPLPETAPPLRPPRAGEPATGTTHA